MSIAVTFIYDDILSEPLGEPDLIADVDHIQAACSMQARLALN